MLAATATAACIAEPEPPTPDAPASCGEPVSGFDRFTEDAAARGIDLEIPGDPSPGSCPYIPGGVVAEDLDADGDVDLLFADPQGFPTAFRNDGSGRFERVTVDVGLPLPGRFALGLAAVDLDGDGLPEVAISGASFAAVASNRGDFAFGPFDVIYDAPEFPRRCINAMAWGDADADGDLDLVLPRLDPVPFEGAPPSDEEAVDPTTGLLLLQRDDGFAAPIPLAPSGGLSVAVLAAVTDHDGDGAPSVLLGADRGGVPGAGPTAFFEPMESAMDFALEDIAGELGIAEPMSVMGIDSQDLNGDGVLDYCLSDALPDSIRCWTSTSTGYADAARSQGFTIDPVQTGDDDDFWFWSTWSLEWTDLDNDGVADLAVAGAPPPPDTCGSGAYCDAQPDAIYSGNGDGTWSNRSAELGWDDPAFHYGLAAADLEGDGYLELILGPWRGRPRIWSNPCGENGWFDVRLVGPAGNRQGIGARVTVQSAARRHVQEVHGPRVMGQSPALVHVGLGQDDLVTGVQVVWPDGAQSTAQPAFGATSLVIEHPSL